MPDEYPDNNLILSDKHGSGDGFVYPRRRRAYRGSRRYAVPVCVNATGAFLEELKSSRLSDSGDNIGKLLVFDSLLAKLQKFLE